MYIYREIYYSYSLTFLLLIPPEGHTDHSNVLKESDNCK